MTYELRDGKIVEIKSPAHQSVEGTLLRCPGCSCISLKLIDGLVDDTCALQCLDSRCGTIYQIIAKLAWPHVKTAEGGTQVADDHEKYGHEIFE